MAQHQQSSSPAQVHVCLQYAPPQECVLSVAALAAASMASMTNYHPCFQCLGNQSVPAHVRCLLQTMFLTYVFGGLPSVSGQDIVDVIFLAGAGASRRLTEQGWRRTLVWYLVTACIASCLCDLKAHLGTQQPVLTCHCHTCTPLPAVLWPHASSITRAPDA
jgi:hypothetical protein